MSTSINPKIALKFTNSIKTKNVNHVLQIKIRKGQKVGAYLGHKSEYPIEQEYLLKANHLLKIHPEYKSYIDKNGNEVRIHHAIILEPHEYADLEEHNEVKKFKNMRESIVNAGEEYKKHLDNLIETGKLPTYDIQNFDKRHVDKLINNPDYHKLLSEHALLEPQHIDNIIQSNDNNTLVNLAKQKNLTDTHINHLISKNNHYINNSLLENNNITLPTSFIDKIIEKPIYHTQLSKKSYINDDHISKIIEKSNDYEPLYNLAKRDDLKEHHIDDLLNMRDDSINGHISTNKNLNNRHIERLLKTNSALVGLSTRKDLNNNHITKLLLSSDYHNKDLIVRNIIENHNLTDEHKILAKDVISNFTDTEKKKLDEPKSLSISQQFYNKYNTKLTESVFEKYIFKNLH